MRKEKRKKIGGVKIEGSKEERVSKETKKERGKD